MKADADWIGPRMYLRLEELLRSALEESVGFRAVNCHLAPSHGSSADLSNRSPDSSACINTSLFSLDPREKCLRFANGVKPRNTQASYRPALPPDCAAWSWVRRRLLAAAGRLAFSQPLRSSNFGINRRIFQRDRHHLFPTTTKDIVFSRVNLPHMFSPGFLPPPNNYSGRNLFLG